MKTVAIVLAAGSGKRMNSSTKKQYLLLGDKPILYYSLKAFEDSFVDEIVIVTGPEDAEGVMRPNVYRLAKSVWNDALYAESPKDRNASAKLIYERVGGKPKVMADEEIQDIPEIVLRVNPKTDEQIRQLAQREDLEPMEEQEGNIVVRIDGEDGELEF